MKKLLCASAVILSSYFTMAGNIIPNNSFEIWISNTWTYDPEFWQTSNSELLAPTVVPDSDSYSGVLAMSLRYYGALQPMASSGFNISSHPDNLGGYIKNQMSPYDSVRITVRIYFYSQLVDSGFTVMHGSGNPYYAPFIIPISQNSLVADYCEIIIEGQMSVNQSGISFDDLQFDFSLGIQETNYRFSLYPNPCSDRVILETGLPDFFPERIEAYDIAGRKVIIPFEKESANSYITILNTSVLSAGAWIITASRGRESYSTTLIRQ